MDTLLHVLPSSRDCRATARIVGRRSVVPCRDGSGEFIPPLNIKELDEHEANAIMARGGKPYIVYTIEMAQVTPFRKSWSIEKRYRQFVTFAFKMNKLLAKKFKGQQRSSSGSNSNSSYVLSKMKLPPKQVFMVDDNFLQKRQVGLDQWIQQVPKLFQEYEVEDEPIFDAIRSFLLPPALQLLRQKKLHSETASTSSCTSEPTPPSSPNFLPGLRSKTSFSFSSSFSSFSSSSMPKTGGILGLESDDIYIAPPPADDDGDDDVDNVDDFDEESDGDGDGDGDGDEIDSIHPQQALALVSSGSYVVEWSDDDGEKKTVNNTFCIPLQAMSNVITIVYRDGCYTYFRASLLLRRIVKEEEIRKASNGQTETKAERLKRLEKNVEKNIKKWLKIPDDELYSDTGTAVFPVRYQNLKVGHVKVHAKLKESETLRKSLQLRFKKVETYGPCGVLIGCLMMYLSTWLLMVVATILGFLGYGLFRPLHRELELIIVPSSSTRKRLAELNIERKKEK